MLRSNSITNRSRCGPNAEATILGIMPIRCSAICEESGFIQPGNGLQGLNWKETSTIARLTKKEYSLRITQGVTQSVQQPLAKFPKSPMIGLSRILLPKLQAVCQKRLVDIHSNHSSGSRRFLPLCRIDSFAGFRSSPGLFFRLLLN